MRQQAREYVDDGGLHSALREMRVHMGDPRVIGGLGIAALVLGFSGPFGTFADLETVPRLIYWAAIVVATNGMGCAAAVVLGRLLGDRLKNRAARVIALGLLMGPLVTGAVLIVNSVAFGEAAIDIVTLWFNCTLVSTAVMTAAEILPRPATPTATAAPRPPPILERVPLPQRGRLLTLSVADHYVEIATDRGKALVLMRLSDAIREIGSVKGLQIHRSHWVALAAVKRSVRAEGKLWLELTDGRRLPVSRSFVDAARSAGLVS